MRRGFTDRLSFPREGGCGHLYLKKVADLNHPSPVVPEWQQLYIGLEKNGEWVNHTLDVKKAGRYKIAVLYSHVAQTIHFSLNDKPAAECRLPLGTGNLYPERHDPAWMVFPIWNKSECGEITFLEAGLQLPTLHYKQGNNPAYFDFSPAGE